jgi:hypothetical protein
MFFFQLIKNLIVIQGLIYNDVPISPMSYRFLFMELGRSRKYSIRIFPFKSVINLDLF